MRAHGKPTIYSLRSFHATGLRQIYTRHVVAVYIAISPSCYMAEKSYNRYYIFQTYRGLQNELFLHSKSAGFINIVLPIFTMIIGDNMHLLHSVILALVFSAITSLAACNKPVSKMCVLRMLLRIRKQLRLIPNKWQCLQ